MTEADDYEARVVLGRAEYNAKLGQLRARARKLGMTIRSSRSSEYYYVGRPNGRDFGRARCCNGIEEIEGWLFKLGAALGDLSSKPSDERLNEAWEIANKKCYDEWHARFLASKRPTCKFCNEPSDGSDESRVGPDEVYWWVHQRCYEPFTERNRRRLEEGGYVGGIKTTVFRA